MRWKYLSVLGKNEESIEGYMEYMVNLGYFAEYKIVSEYVEGI